MIWGDGAQVVDRENTVPAVATRDAIAWTLTSALEIKGTDL